MNTQEWHEFLEREPVQGDLAGRARDQRVRLKRCCTADAGGVLRWGDGEPVAPFDLADAQAGCPRHQHDAYDAHLDEILGRT